MNCQTLKNKSIYIVGTVIVLFPREQYSNDDDGNRSPFYIKTAMNQLSLYSTNFKQIIIHV